MFIVSIILLRGTIVVVGIVIVIIIIFGRRKSLSLSGFFRIRSAIDLGVVGVPVNREFLINSIAESIDIEEHGNLDAHLATTTETNILSEIGKTRVGLIGALVGDEEALGVLAQDLEIFAVVDEVINSGSKKREGDESDGDSALSSLLIR